MRRRIDLVARAHRDHTEPPRHTGALFFNRCCGDRNRGRYHRHRPTIGCGTSRVTGPTPAPNRLMRVGPYPQDRDGRPPLRLLLLPAAWGRFLKLRAGRRPTLRHQRLQGRMGPKRTCGHGRNHICSSISCSEMAHPTGFEPVTSAFGGTKTGAPSASQQNNLEHEIYELKRKNTSSILQSVRISCIALGHFALTFHLRIG